MKGYAENAICPHCRTYTLQKIVSRGVRRCMGCGCEFELRNVDRIQRNKLIPGYYRDGAAPHRWRNQEES